MKAGDLVRVIALKDGLHRSFHNNVGLVIGGSTETTGWLKVKIGDKVVDCWHSWLKPLA